MVISNLDFDKRKKKKKKEEKEKKFGNSKPRHFPKEIAEAKIISPIIQGGMSVPGKT